MNKQKEKIAIAFITYGKLTAKYLPYFFNSLKEQTYQNFKIFIADNTEEENNLNKKFIQQKKQDFEIDFFWNKKNIGFARAYNKLIDKARKENFKYILIINPDIILDARAIEQMLATIKSDKKIASVSPKILKWDFKNNKKTKIIDTCGIKLLPGLRFIDIGQGEQDLGRYDKAQILGPSGAGGLFRVEALEQIKDEYGYFDKRMFMYKEDCDLVYRLKLKNFKSALNPRALLYHDRSVEAIGQSWRKLFLSQRKKSAKVKKWSQENQNLIYKKHWQTLSLLNKFFVQFYRARYFVYNLFF